MGIFETATVGLRQGPNGGAEYNLLLKSLGAIALVGIARFFYNLHEMRMRVRRVAKEHGIPILPHYYLIGHFPHIIKMFIKRKYPADISGMSTGYLMAQEYPEFAKDGVLFFDTWPVSPPMMWVSDPDMMNQFCVSPSLPKADIMHYEFEPMTGLKDLLTLEGAEWKRWRSIFNPGFSTKNLLLMVPAFLEEIHVFTDGLREQAKTGETALFLDQAMNLTYDVIARAALGQRTHCQTSDNSFKWAMNKQTSWVITRFTLHNILMLMNPFRPVMMWYYNKVMADYLRPIIHGSIAELAAEKPGSNTPKTINTLALQAYLSETNANPQNIHHLDKAFTDSVIAQMKIFMLAGHDTTASTMAFIFAELEHNPTYLAALRAEHTAVFGPDPSTASSQITSSPQLLNSLPYTLAIIKETLRLYPPVSSARQGQPSVFLTSPTSGTRYPTDGFLLCGSHFWEHRSELYWPQANTFLPERWLAKEGDGLHVGKTKWRPFEHGPRNCIGQELALLEMKAILVLVVREMDILTAYGEGDPEFMGRKGYQVMNSGEVASRPKGGMPFRVRMIENGGR